MSNVSHHITVLLAQGLLLLTVYHVPLATFCIMMAVVKNVLLFVQNAKKRVSVFPA